MDGVNISVTSAKANVNAFIYRPLLLSILSPTRSDTATCMAFLLCGWGVGVCVCVLEWHGPQMGANSTRYSTPLFWVPGPHKPCDSSCIPIVVYLLHPPPHCLGTADSAGTIATVNGSLLSWCLASPALKDWIQLLRRWRLPFPRIQSASFCPVPFMCQACYKNFHLFDYQIVQ